MLQRSGEQLLGGGPVVHLVVPPVAYLGDQFGDAKHRILVRFLRALMLLTCTKPEGAVANHDPLGLRASGYLRPPGSVWVTPG
jgi:hypothetical protein